MEAKCVDCGHNKSAHHLYPIKSKKKPIRCKNFGENCDCKGYRTE